MLVTQPGLSEHHTCTFNCFIFVSNPCILLCSFNTESFDCDSGSEGCINVGKDA